MKFEEKLHKALYEDDHARILQQLFNDVHAKLKDVESPITLNDEDYGIVTSIHDSQKTSLNNIFSRYPKLLKSLQGLNDMLFSKWTSESDVARQTKEYMAKELGEEITALGNLVQDYKVWARLAQAMIRQGLSAADRRRVESFAGAIGAMISLLTKLGQVMSV